MNRRLELAVSIIAIFSLGCAVGAAIASGSWETWESRIPWSITLALIWLPVFLGRSK